MAYNMDKYKDLDDINSQISEQRNNSLRKLSNTLAFYKSESYMKILELFFGLTNLKIKNVISSPAIKDSYTDWTNSGEKPFFVRNVQSLFV